ncbi:MAG TPA: ion transporter [Patescibacteria group bacterium]|nr:ion transporter [Patescibacteria group bacterium]
MTPQKRRSPRQLQEVNHQRLRLLNHVTQLTDKLMIVLAFVWIGLMIADFLGRLGPSLAILNYVIWGLFLLDFAVKLIIAPQKGRFLRQNWITLVSLLLPAFRVLRIFQALRAFRALSLLRMLTSVNRGMSALVVAMGKRGVGYVVALTIIVLFSGAAGMFFFENPGQLREQGFDSVAAAGGGLHSYGDALWWTSMLMTTIGSQYWPVTGAGRGLCFIVSLYSLGVFGYITATLASFFVDSAAQTPTASKNNIDDLKNEIAALRREMKGSKLKRRSGAIDGD